MAEYMPFQGTTVPAEKSISEILVALRKTGFDRTGQLQDCDTHRVVAEKGGVQFAFTANPRDIERKLREAGVRRRSVSQDTVREQSERIAWRLVAEQVKAACHAIQYGAMDVAEAFAGQVLLSDATGTVTKLSHQLVHAAASGALKTINPLSALLLEDRSADTRGG